MKLLFKQRIFSWLDSYDIYDENWNRVFRVEGKLSFGHRLHVLNAHQEHVATLQQKVISFMPKFDIYMSDVLVGSISRRLTFIGHDYNLDYQGWSISKDTMGWDHDVFDSNGRKIASISKQLFQLSDTYVLEIEQSENALAVLMLVLAMDAEKCQK